MNETTKIHIERVKIFDEDFVRKSMFGITIGAIDNLKTNSIDQVHNYLKKTNLAILQSEYDRLEGEKKEEQVTVNHFSDTYKAKSERNVWYNTAIADQQTHLLETINQIKGL